MRKDFMPDPRPAAGVLAADVGGTRLRAAAILADGTVSCDASARRASSAARSGGG